jgi:tRNA(Ile)-lysidine synthase TilS/MesJ
MSGLDSIPHLRGNELIAEYKRRYGDKTLLAFSRGKDSIAVALALRDKIEVVPFHYDDLPGLEFVEESLAYYEKHLFGRHILRCRTRTSTSTCAT